MTEGAASPVAARQATGGTSPTRVRRRTSGSESRLDAALASLDATPLRPSFRGSSLSEETAERKFDPAPIIVPQHLHDDSTSSTSTSTAAALGGAAASPTRGASAAGASPSSRRRRRHSDVSTMSVMSAAATAHLGATAHRRRTGSEDSAPQYRSTFPSLSAESADAAPARPHRRSAQSCTEVSELDDEPSPLRMSAQRVFSSASSPLLRPRITEEGAFGNDDEFEFESPEPSPANSKPRPLVEALSALTPKRQSSLRTAGFFF